MSRPYFTARSATLVKEKLSYDGVPTSIFLLPILIFFFYSREGLRRKGGAVRCLSFCVVIFFVLLSFFCD